MIFKIGLANRLLYLSFFGVFFYIISLTKAIHKVLNASQTAESLILSGLFLIAAIYVLFYNETYVIKDGEVRIKRGGKVDIYKITDINYIYYKSFNNTGRMISINTNEAHIVVGEEKISINTDAKNKSNKSLVDVLNKKYNKRIVYDNSLFK